MDTEKFPEVTMTRQVRAMDLSIEDILILRHIQKAHGNGQTHKTTVNELIRTFNRPRPTMFKKVARLVELGLLYRFDCPGMCHYKGTGRREMHHDISSEGLLFIQTLREAVN